MTQETQDPILSMDRFVVVVTDKKGDKFVLTGENRQASLRFCTPMLADYICHKAYLFNSPDIADKFKTIATALVQEMYSNTRIKAEPPFTAEVVPFTLRIG